MKAIYPFMIGFGIACSAIAQEVPDDTGLTDQVQQAIKEFNRKKNDGKAEENEVVVVLPPPEEQKSQPVEEKPAVAIPVDDPETEPEAAASVPKLVTGKPPAENPAAETEEPEAQAPAPDEQTPVETAPEGKQGLEIRVEAIREGSGEIDPGQVKLKASFPAKSLSPTPDGWILEKSEQAPAFREQVSLRTGKTISLSITPHILTPAADGANTFAVVEPGFEVSDGYRQSGTVSAILGNSVAQLDRDALLLGNAISDLHQLLSSLPKPEPKPEDVKKP